MAVAAALFLAASGCGDDPGIEPEGAGGADADASSTSANILTSSTAASGSPTFGNSEHSGSSENSGDGGAGDGGEGGDRSASAGGGGDGSAGDGSGGDGPAGQGGGAPTDPCPDFASEVVAVVYGPGAGFGQDDFPEVVFGGPHGGGELSGSLDVLSLGNGGSITLGFAERRIIDGEGPDFIVFENSFWAGGDPDLPFAELAMVEVSADGETWKTFPCAALSAPYGSCAGWRPIYANVDDNDIDPLDPAVAGGDAFDLADVGLSEARYVRIVDREDQGGLSGMFDLDAISIVHGVCDADR